MNLNLWFFSSSSLSLARCKYIWTGLVMLIGVLLQLCLGSFRKSCCGRITETKLAWNVDWFGLDVWGNWIARLVFEEEYDVSKRTGELNTYSILSSYILRGLWFSWQIADYRFLQNYKSHTAHHDRGCVETLIFFTIFWDSDGGLCDKSNLSYASRIGELFAKMWAVFPVF